MLQAGPGSIRVERLGMGEETKLWRERGVNWEEKRHGRSETADFPYNTRRFGGLPQSPSTPRTSTPHRVHSNPHVICTPGVRELERAKYVAQQVPACLPRYHHHHHHRSRMDSSTSVIQRRPTDLLGFLVRNAQLAPKIQQLAWVEDMSFCVTLGRK